MNLFFVLIHTLHRTGSAYASKIQVTYPGKGCPALRFLFPLDASVFGKFSYEDVDYHMPQQGGILSREFCSGTALVFSEGNVQAPGKRKGRSPFSNQQELKISYGMRV